MEQKKNLPAEYLIKPLIKLVITLQLQILREILMLHLMHYIPDARASKQQVTENKEKLFYTTEDVMEMLSISRRTLQTLRNEGKIGFVKVYNTIRFSKEDIERFKVEARGEEREMKGKEVRSR